MAIDDTDISIVIEEQGLRDGLQSEPKVVPTDRKLELIEALIGAGISRIQVCSFVHPKRVPQMADAEAVCAGLSRRPGVVYSALVLNLKGVERAVAAGLDHVAASISASDTHSRKNAGMSLDEAQSRYAEMVRTAKADGLTVRGGLQCAFGCRFEGASWSRTISSWTSTSWRWPIRPEWPTPARYKI
jgi:hydroxymethylglutaryl-CoA lyase